MDIDLLSLAELRLADAHERNDGHAVAVWAQTAQWLYDNLDPLDHLEFAKRTAT